MDALLQPSLTFPTQQSQIMANEKPHYHLGLQAKPPGAYASCSGWLGCILLLVAEVLKQLLKIRGVTRRGGEALFCLDLQGTQHKLPAMETILSILRASAFKLGPHCVSSPVLVGW